uniref:COMM domain containing 10 n=1 Tax=Oncorhynchus mykiss TaxID=8022 RepID=A0A8K9XMR2_ONCMY
MPAVHHYYRSSISMPAVHHYYRSSISMQAVYHYYRSSITITDRLSQCRLSITITDRLSQCRLSITITDRLSLCRLSITITDRLSQCRLSITITDRLSQCRLSITITDRLPQCRLSITYRSSISMQAVYHNVKPASLKQQLEKIHLSPEKAEAFCQAWTAVCPDVVEKVRQRIFAPKKLEHVGWQLNLQMAKSTQAKLKDPHAVLELGVRNEDSESVVEKVFVEFSHQELLQFYNQLETVQAQLDSLT